MANRESYCYAPPSDFWPDKIVDWNRERRGMPKRFKETLEAASDERPLQRFFEQRPYALALGVLGGPHQCWVFPKPNLGAEYIPDFLICNWLSNGPSWHVIELENPTFKPTTKRGSISHRCHKGIEQVADYRGWLRENIAYATLQQKYIGISGNCSGWVIIGRRNYNRGELEQRRLADFSWQNNIQIASYDRLLETFSFYQQAINRQSRQIRALANSVKQKRTWE